MLTTETLKIFNYPKVERRRDFKIYRQPLVLVREGFRYDRNRGRALLAKGDDNIAYNKSFFGLSCFSHPLAECLADYLLLLFHSKFVFFYLLSASSKLGIERDALLLEDVTNFPFIPLEQLTQDQQQRIQQLASQMLSTPASPSWAEIDALIEEIYGLNKWDRQVIEDTLATCLPDGTQEAKLAAVPCGAAQKERFKEALFAAMEPFFSVTGRKLSVCLADSDQNTPWAFLDINATGQTQAFPEQLCTSILEKADDLMVSRIIQTWEDCPACLRVGILDQARYWTASQARLLAADLLRNYGHQLEQGS